MTLAPNLAIPTLPKGARVARMAFRIPHLAACWAHEEASGLSACNLGPGIETFLNRRVSVSYIGRHEYEEEEEEKTYLSNGSVASGVQVSV